MDHTEYIKECIKTEQQLPDDSKHDLEMIKLTLTLASALGAFANIVKREVFYNKGPKEGESYNSRLEAIEKAVSNLSDHVMTVPSQRGKGVSGPNLRLIHGALGYITETGELSETLEKGISRGYLDMEEIRGLAEEISDVCWYQSVLLDVLRVSLPEIFNANIAKLRVRHGTSYNPEACDERNVDKELAAFDSHIKYGEG